MSASVEEAAETIKATMERVRALRAEAADLARRAGVRHLPKVEGVHNPTCSFCGSDTREVKAPPGRPGMIAGPGTLAICSECVDMCVELFEENGHVLPMLAAARARPEGGATP